jgi:hypothetical protein
MLGLRRKEPCKPAPPTALEQVTAEIAAVLVEAHERVDRMLERLRAREPKQGARNGTTAQAR